MFVFLWFFTSNSIAESSYLLNQSSVYLGYGNGSLLLKSYDASAFCNATFITLVKWLLEMPWTRFHTLSNHETSKNWTTSSSNSNEFFVQRSRCRKFARYNRDKDRHRYCKRNWQFSRFATVTEKGRVKGLKGLDGFSLIKVWKKWTN